MAFPLKNKKLIFFLIILILISLIEVGYFFYLKQKSNFSKKQESKSSITNEGMNVLALKASKVNQETVLQQATMSASAKDTIVPEGCNKLPYTDPLIGIFQYKQIDKEKNIADYVYLGKIVKVSEEARGNCIDNIIVLESNVDNKPIQFNLRIPKQMTGAGALGVILPKVLQYKQGLRVQLSINYTNNNTNLIINKWEVVNLYLN